LFDDEAMGMIPPDIEAVRWFDAAVAAAEGSSELASVRDLPSCMVVGRCVGELFLGVELKSFFEKVLVKLLFSVNVWVMVGEVTSC
jgi:hypothetical protein